MARVRLLALVCWAAAGMSAGELSVEQWRADIAFLAKELPARHKNLFHTLSKADFERQVNQLIEAIPKLSSNEIHAAIVRLVAAAADGHTYAEWPADGTFDLSFVEFPEGVYVVSAAKGYDEAIGARLLAVDGVTVADARKRLVDMVSAENEYGLKDWVRWLRNPEALNTAGIAKRSDGAQFLLEKDGRRFPLAAHIRLRKDKRPEYAKDTFEQPLWMQHTDRDYWWQYLAESKTLYIQYNSCSEMTSLPFRKFTEQIVDQVSREAPAKVVIDLRINGGGNSEVSNPLLDAMRSSAALRPRGGVYVLTRDGTFSSGLMVAVRFTERFHAMLVGEPSSQRPNHYGDLRSFTLPNSGVKISYSTKHFFQVEGDPPALMPDLPVPLTAADYFGGRDRALEEILKLPPDLEANLRAAIAKDKTRAHPYEALLGIYLESGRQADAAKLLRDGVAANPRSTELRLLLAMLYLNTKQYSEARKAAASAIHINPGAAQAHCYLGQADLAERKFQPAADAFHECFRLDPDNTNAVKRAANGYMQAGKYDAAIGEFQAAIARLKGDSDSIELRLQLSEAYRRKGDAAAAVRTFLEDWPPIVEFARAANQDVGMIAGMLRNFFEEKLKTEPDDPVLMHNLAYVLAKSGGDMERARVLAKRSSERLPGVPEVAATAASIGR